MATLRITAFEGDQKVEHTKCLMAAGLRLADAKRVTDDLLDGRSRDIEVSDVDAERHARELRKLGAVVEVLTSA